MPLFVELPLLKFIDCRAGPQRYEYALGTHVSTEYNICIDNIPQLAMKQPQAASRFYTHLTMTMTINSL